MSSRLLCLFALLLLGACSSKAPAPPASPAPAAQAAAVEPPLLPGEQELTGTLSSPQGDLPSGSEVEIALLVLSERGQPQQTLSSLRLRATGGSLPFRLRFDTQAFPSNARVQLHARVARSGQLAWRLPPVTIFQAQNQALGDLRLVPAP
ncbi:MAG: hypothetical protein GAK43_01523 [Stenotrophomonas maltophilia]|nr:MAG: hypothetical protein GAK43_01523 [Stenotrophomonas maltophilia]